MPNLNSNNIISAPLILLPNICHIMPPIRCPPIKTQRYLPSEKRPDMFVRAFLNLVKLLRCGITVSQPLRHTPAALAVPHLFHGHRLCQVFRLIDIASFCFCHIISKKLQRNDLRYRQQQRIRLGHQQGVIRLCKDTMLPFLHHAQHPGAPGDHHYDGGQELIQNRRMAGQRHYQPSLIDQGNGAVLELPGRIGLGMDVADLLQLQRSFHRHGIIQISADKEQ